MASQSHTRTGSKLFVTFLLVILLFATFSPLHGRAETILLSSQNQNYDLTFDEIESNYDKLSKRGFEEYFSTIEGTRVHWTAEVTGAKENYLSVDMGQAWFRTIFLNGVGSKDALDGDVIEFEATIDHFSRFLGFTLYFEDTIILKVNGGKATGTDTNRSTTTATATPQSTKTPTPTATLAPFGEASFGNNINVRNGPGLNFQVTKVMKPGETLPIYGRSTDSAWLWVDPIEQIWVAVSVATADVTITALPLGPTMAPTATRTLVPTKTPLPTQTLIPAVSLIDIYDNSQSMTELQFKEYKNTVFGKPIREYVKIGNVSDRGVVSLSGPWSPWLFNVSDFCVAVTGMPKETALQLEGGDRVYLEATINGIVGDYNYYYNCENTLLLTFKKLGRD